MEKSRHNKVNKAEVSRPVANLNQTDKEGLIGRAAGGDTEAFGELYSNYVNRIYQYVFYHVNDKMLAEDITEDIFVKAWKAIGSYKGKEETFLPWLFSIARNHLIDVYRKKKRELKTDSTIEIETVADINNDGLKLEKKLVWQQLLNAMAYLPENQKQVIILKFIEGLNNREVGQVMRKNQGAIRILQMRAIATLRQTIHKEI